jgi:hypothetical protein
MKFSWDAALNDVVALWRTHAEVLSILAGLFLMVPQFAQLLFFPLPQIAQIDQAAIDLIERYFQDNALWFLLLSLLVLLGSSTILSLIVDARRPTVGEAIVAALVMLPSIFVLNLLIQLSIFGALLLFVAPAAYLIRQLAMAISWQIFGALLLFVIPAAYLIGRLAVATTWQMANRSMNPIAAITRSLALTRGNGWRIGGVIILVWLIGYIMARGLGAILGIVISFIIPAMSLAAVAAFLLSIISAAFSLVMLLLAAAIYRQLAPRVG